MIRSEKEYQPFLNSLDRLGFCTLPVFGQEEIEQLRQLYAMHFEQKSVEGMYANHNSNPAELGVKISSDIKQIVAEKLLPLFSDYNYFIGHFVVKGAHTEKEFSLHQDWNIVDESQYKSYQVWIPLQFTYPANGGMFVMPGSHKFLGNYRSGSYGIPVVPFDENLEPLVTDINLPAGHILVFSNSLFHASNANITNEMRIAVIVNLVEKKAPTAYFHKRADLQCTELYAITGNSLIAHLPDLEKGIIGSDLPLMATLPLQQLDNSTVTSAQLAKSFHQYFKTGQGAQIKQLHITREQTLEDELNEVGYKVIDLLNPDEVALFKNNYLSNFGGKGHSPGRFTTLQYTDSEGRKMAHKFITEHIKPVLDKYFKDYVMPIALYYTKKAHTSGDIDLHADTTLILNHQLEPHYAVWVPLVDVDAANGTLTVVPRSHLVKRAFFAATIHGYHVDQMDFLRNYEVPLKLKAGQAVIFDNNLLHNSTANTTDGDRICFTLRITHYASGYYSFLQKSLADDAIEVYSEQGDYYLNQLWDGDNKRPLGKYVGRMRFSIPKIDRKKLQQILEG